MTAVDAVPAQAAQVVEVSDLASRQGLRCTVRLPMSPYGWGSVLARCDGRPVAVGYHDVYRPGDNAAQYAQDMQVIVTALSRPVPGFPTWLAVLASLLGAGALYGLIKAGARRLPTLHSPLHWPELPVRRLARVRRHSTISKH